MLMPNSARAKPLAALCLITGLWSAGCCPDGTVSCRMSRIRLVLDVESRRLELQREFYRTCVVPGECPAPPDGTPEPGGPDPGPGENPADSLLADLGYKVASGFLSLGSRDIEFRIRALRADIGRLENSEALVRVVQRDEFGVITKDLTQRVQLDIVQGLGGDWVLRPATDLETRRFIKEAIRMLIGSERPQDTTVEYTLSARFDKLPQDTSERDFVSDVRVAGVVLE